MLRSYSLLIGHSSFSHDYLRWICNIDAPYRVSDTVVKLLGLVEYLRVFSVFGIQAPKGCESFLSFLLVLKVLSWRLLKSTDDGAGISSVLRHLLRWVDIQTASELIWLIQIGNKFWEMTVRITIVRILFANYPHTLRFALDSFRRSLLLPNGIFRAKKCTFRFLNL